MKINNRNFWRCIALSIYILTASCQAQVGDENINNEQNLEKENMNDYQNELGKESSPYLLQHKNNPVHWLPWGEKAFTMAKERQVPIIISIGYSTCHWCHVMEHEVFEDMDAATLMNNKFVCIKVDREERPEVDEIYMNALHAMQQRGGWPLNVVVTPEGKPFFGGTYFPKAQWIQILTSLDDAWQNQREKVNQVAQELTTFLQESSDYPIQSVPADVWKVLEKKLDEYYDAIDPAWGNAPKFPSSQMLRLVLLLKSDKNKQQALNILTTMQDSGLHDIVGGGFHRYSTDSEWRVPHFEKMLYDNALLAICYFIAGHEHQREDLQRTGMRTLDYLLRDMRIYDENKKFLGYACAEDADDPGGEGSFYAWSPELLQKVLGEEVAKKLAEEWNVAKGKPHTNHLGHSEPVTSHIPFPRGGSLKRNSQTPEAIALRLSWEKHYPLLLEERSKRPRPGLDYKVLSSWNGLALSAFSHGFRFTGDEKYRKATRELADILLARHQKNGLIRLGSVDAFINDYGFVLCGLMDAYDALGDADLIDGAIKVADEAITKLADPKGGFFATTADRQDLIVRSRVLYDNAYPSGNSTMALGLIRLWNITSEQKYYDEAKKSIEIMGVAINQANISLGTLLTAYLALERGHITMVVTGTSENKEELLAQCRKNNYLATIIDVEKVKDKSWSILEGRKDLQETMALLCVDKTCLAPAKTIEKIKESFTTYENMFSH